MTLDPDRKRSGPRVAGGGVDRPPGRKFIATNPPRAYSTSDLDALSTFVSNGGAVVLTASAEATDRIRSNLNDVAAGLGSDLRINDDQVFDAYSDDTSSTNGAPTVDSLSVSEVDPDDSDAGFDANWAVSDADGDLAEVTTELVDGSGTVLNSDSDAVRSWSELTLPKEVYRW